LKIGFIGDVVGKPGRLMIKRHFTRLRQEHFIDYMIANYENASHGFGLTEKNCIELLGYDIDMMTGGNHSFDKKEILSLFDTYPLIRPMNYPKATPGKGIYETTLLGHETAILNLMGNFAMPMVDNPFRCATDTIEGLEAEGVKNIFIDMHAEATSEKRGLLMMFKSRVSAIVGTHTHVGTDDLQIDEGTGSLTVIGLSGCRV